MAKKTTAKPPTTSAKPRRPRKPKGAAAQAPATPEQAPASRDDFELRSAGFYPPASTEESEGVSKIPAPWPTANEVNSRVEWLWVQPRFLKQGDTFRLLVTGPTVKSWRAMADLRVHSRATYTEYTLLEDAKSLLDLQGITPLSVGGRGPDIPQAVVVVTDLGQFLVDSSKHVEAHRPGGFQFRPDNSRRVEPRPPVKHERIEFPHYMIPPGWKFAELGIIGKWKALWDLAKGHPANPNSPLVPEMDEALEQNSFLYELARAEIQGLQAIPLRMVQKVRGSVRRALKKLPHIPLYPGVKDPWWFLREPGVRVNNKGRWFNGL